MITFTMEDEARKELDQSTCGPDPPDHTSTYVSHGETTGQDLRGVGSNTGQHAQSQSTRGMQHYFALYHTSALIREDARLRGPSPSTGAFGITDKARPVAMEELQETGIVRSTQQERECNTFTPSRRRTKGFAKEVMNQIHTARSRGFRSMGFCKIQWLKRSTFETYAA